MGSPPTWAPSDALGLVDLDVIHAYIREPDRIGVHRREVELLKMPRPKLRSSCRLGRVRARPLLQAEPPLLRLRSARLGACEEEPLTVSDCNGTGKHRTRTDTDADRRPPGRLKSLIERHFYAVSLVGDAGFEPATSSL